MKQSGRKRQRTEKTVSEYERRYHCMLLEAGFYDDLARVIMSYSCFGDPMEAIENGEFPFDRAFDMETALVVAASNGQELIVNALAGTTIPLFCMDAAIENLQIPLVLSFLKYENFQMSSAQKEIFRIQYELTEPVSFLDQMWNPESVNKSMVHYASAIKPEQSRIRFGKRLHSTIIEKAFANNNDKVGHCLAERADPMTVVLGVLRSCRADLIPVFLDRYSETCESILAAGCGFLKRHAQAFAFLDWIGLHRPDLFPNKQWFARCADSVEAQFPSLAEVIRNYN